MNKAVHETCRDRVECLEEIVNVGPATAEDLRLMGVAKPQELIGRDPWQLYQDLCLTTRAIHDPCCLDVFMAAVDFMNGRPPRKWWEYTSTRKREYGSRLARFSI